MALAFAVACSVSPQPTPPALDENTVVGIADEGLVEGVFDVEEDRASDFRVYLFNLDTLGPPETATLADDGSFSVPFVGVDGDLVRLHLFDGAVLTQAFDARFEDGALMREPPMLPCFRITPPQELFFDVPDGDVGVVELMATNECDDPVTVTDLEFSDLTTNFDLVFGEDDVLDPGDTRRLLVTWTPGDPGDVVQVLVVTLDGGPFRAVTVAGRAF
ncbi:MAG: hypothetical protein AAGE52_26120 [Myxococcota bacterium]